MRAAISIDVAFVASTVASARFPLRRGRSVPVALLRGIVSNALHLHLQGRSLRTSLMDTQTADATLSTVTPLTVPSMAVPCIVRFHYGEPSQEIVSDVDGMEGERADRRG
jgi:hypothetical protein